MRYKLSKSTFIRGLQCEKSLYLYKKHYKLKDPTSPSLQAIFDQGNQIGVLAQSLFPGGVDASPSSHFRMMESVIKTKAFLESGESIIYEAETVPPYTDINGSWHVKFETIMKCFSEENLEKELDELLKLNNISKDSGKVNLNVMSGTEPLTFYEGNGFTIEIPPVDGSRKLIVIKKDE